MKQLIKKWKSLPTSTSVHEMNTQELQLLVDALARKSNELGLTMNLTFNSNEQR